MQTSQSSIPGDVAEEGDSPATVLLCGPHGESWGPIWDQRDPESVNVLAITTHLDPLEWIDACEQQLGTLPMKTGAIRLGTPIDPLTTDHPSHEGADLPLTAVERPSDLDELYTAINLYITEWLHTDQQTLIWLESLTPVIEHVGAKRTIAFVESLAERLRMTGTVAYARLDPRDHDEHTRSMIRSAFDRVVEIEADGPAVAADSREELVLRALRAEGRLSADALAGRVAANENARHPDGYDPANARLIEIDLYHASLPKLADAGFVNVEWDERIVELAVEPERIDGLLERRNGGAR
ncbi:DUF7504 family protein [Halalkalicoccus subterraneus]|uniref:DUF7504 family protein n=1 Tax=Halalkalicoccus subterraneus TaxID=2675002 RepID=UPI000EFAEF7F|nr:hypothetical protein [Halalkalicoccus subterraneus]